MIFCVSGDPFRQSLYRRGLSDLGLIITSDGEAEGLRQYEKQRGAHDKPDIIIIDENLPSLNGLRFLIALQEKYTELPPRLMAAKSASEYLYQKVREAGGIGLLKRPIDFGGVLIPIIRELLNNQKSPTLEYYVRHEQWVLYQK